MIILKENCQIFLKINYYVYSGCRYSRVKDVNLGKSLLSLTYLFIFSYFMYIIEYFKKQNSKK